MYTLDLCRICLLSPVGKDIRDLKVCENNKSETYVEILLFSLDIQVVENSAISTKLCERCYDTILAYHKFKTLALRNDYYLKTIKLSTVKLEQIIKDEPDSEPEIDDINTELKIDIEEKSEFDNSKSDDDDPLSSVVALEEVEKEKSPVNENRTSEKGTRYDELKPNMSEPTEEQVMAEEDHPVSDSFVAVKEAPSSSKLSNNNATDNKPPEMKHKTIENSNTEDIERNLKKTNNLIDRSILQKRIKIHTGEKPYACDRCDKKFAERSKLQRHIRIHTGENPYACEICDKKFARKHHLEIHLRIHKDENPYACDRCDKKFTQKSNLGRHLRIRTDEKPYVCGYCDKKFTQKSHLEQHLRIHTGEKPNACDRCDKKFAVRSNLQRHLRIHTDEKPYACDVCKKKFTESGSLKNHIRIHTGEKPYACKTCDKKFTLKSTLRKHTIRIHT